jgi:hypothetical protein
MSFRTSAFPLLSRFDVFPFKNDSPTSARSGEDESSGSDFHSRIPDKTSVLLDEREADFVDGVKQA